MTAREYALVTFATLQAAMVIMMKEQGVKIDTKKVVAEMGLNLSNLEFAEKHRKQIEELGRSHQQLQKLTDRAAVTSMSDPSGNICP